MEKIWNVKINKWHRILGVNVQKMYHAFLLMNSRKRKDSMRRRSRIESVNTGAMKSVALVVGENGVFWELKLHWPRVLENHSLNLLRGGSVVGETDGQADEWTLRAYNTSYTYAKRNENDTKNSWRTSRTANGSKSIATRIAPVTIWTAIYLQRYVTALITAIGNAVRLS